MRLLEALGELQRTGSALAVNGYFVPVDYPAVPSFWQGDTGTAAIPLELLGKLRHGVVP